MKIDNFERLLLVELTESITKNPDLWEKSRLGIKRNDELHLYVTEKEISIFQPKEYEFKNTGFKETLHKIAYKLYQELHNKWEIDLFNTVIISLKNPDNWEKSVYGIKQKGDYYDDTLIEINITNSSYSDNKANVQKPTEHTFKSPYSETLKKISFEVLDYIKKKEKVEKEQESRNDLSKFFNFDDRLHKLKMLKIIAEEEKIKKEEEIEELKEEEIAIVEKNKNIFQKFLSLFHK